MTPKRLREWADTTARYMLFENIAGQDRSATLQQCVQPLIAEVRREVLEEAAKMALVGPQTIGAANGETKWPADWADHHHLAYAERRGENQMAQHNYAAIRQLAEREGER